MSGQVRTAVAVKYKRESLGRSDCYFHAKVCHDLTKPTLLTNCLFQLCLRKVLAFLFVSILYIAKQACDFCVPDKTFSMKCAIKSKEILPTKFLTHRMFSLSFIIHLFLLFSLSKCLSALHFFLLQYRICNLFFMSLIRSSLGLQMNRCYTRSVRLTFTKFNLPNDKMYLCKQMSKIFVPCEIDIAYGPSPVTSCTEVYFVSKWLFDCSISILFSDVKLCNND